MWGMCVDVDVLDGDLFQSAVEYLIKNNKAIVISPIDNIVLDISKIVEVPSIPQFVYGEFVSPITHLDMKGTIHTIKWHFNSKSYYYQIQVNGRVKSKRYFGKELVRVMQ